MPFSVSLAVPANLAFGSLIDAFVNDCTARAALPAAKREAIRTAASRAFGILVTDAMAETGEPIRVHLSDAADALTLSVIERGLPIDAAYAARDPRWSELLVHADRAVWRWHGKSGTELMLTFLHDITGEMEAPLPDAIAGSNASAAPEQTYTVRRFTPQDARGVARCFYATYGYGYNVPAVYEPRRLCQLNEAQTYVSFVALDESGEVIAHYALRRTPGAPIAEGCGAVVDPRHRGRHLLETLRSRIEEHAREAGLSAYYTEPVTDHPITQHESEKFGARITSISLGHSPRTMLAKHMDGLTATSQRQSLTMYVKPLQPPQPRVIYPPARHRDMLARIYAELGIPVEMREGIAPVGEGSLQTSIDKASQIAVLSVETASAATPDIADQAVEDLRRTGSLGAIYAMLPLDDRGTPLVADALEREGFFFSGLCPWMHDGRDALRLQLMMQPIDTGELTIVGDFGRELLAYINSSR